MFAPMTSGNFGIPFSEGPRTVVSSFSNGSQIYRFEDFNDADFDDHVCTAVPLNDFEVRITSIEKNAAFRHDLRGPNGTLIADLTPRNSAVIEHFLGKSSYGINNQVRSLTLEQDSSKILLMEYLKLVCEVVAPDDNDDFHEFVPEFHPGGIVNVLYVGGHVRTVRVDEIDQVRHSLTYFYWQQFRGSCGRGPRNVVLHLEIQIFSGLKIIAIFKLPFFLRKAMYKITTSRRMRRHRPETLTTHFALLESIA